MKQAHFLDSLLSSKEGRNTLSITIKWCLFGIWLQHTGKAPQTTLNRFRSIKREQSDSSINSVNIPILAHKGAVGVLCLYYSCSSWKNTGLKQLTYFHGSSSKALDYSVCPIFRILNL